MPDKSPIIWRFMDGKAGHENQSLALVENLQQLAPFKCVELPESKWERADLGPKGTWPDLVLGAGHQTHRPILAAARRFDCPSVVIMKPTIPRAFFDLCFIPQHDLSGDPAENVVVTRGMLNRVPATIPPKENRGLLLVGGPSKHHGWDLDALVRNVTRIVRDRPQLDWHLTDSRRTPDDFLDHLASLDLSIHLSKHTPPDWLPRQLLIAREVWVTEDSMSMIYEALTARARVGLLPMPRKSRRGRIIRGIDRLVAERWTCFLGEDATRDLPEPPGVLHEASRCAREVLQRFFPALV